MTLHPRHAPALALLLVAIAYLPALAGGFVWDDALLVVENQLTGSWVNLPAMFATDLWATTPKVEAATSGYYRPLVLVDFAIDRALFGLWAPGHHLHSLAWHLGCVGLLGLLARQLGAGPISASAGMLVLGLHPAAVEPVAWISARNDLMATAGVLGALALLMPYAPSRRRLVGASLVLLGAFLSKESALLAPVAILALRSARYRQLRPVGPWVAVGGALAVYGLLRMTAGVGLPAGADLERVGLRALSALAWWGHDLVMPLDLAPGRNLTWSSAAPFGVGLVGWGVVALILRPAGHHGRLGLLLMALGLLPALAAVAHTGEVATRYLYLPLAGLGLATAGLVTRRVRSPKVGVALVGSMGLLFALLTTLSLPTWRDDGRLWTAAVATHPSPYTWGGLAKTLEDAGRLDAAAHAYRQATDGPRPFPEACYNAAQIHLKRGRPDAAAAAGRRALVNGCPRSPELLAPTAIGVAIGGGWEEAEGLAAEIPRDPTGMAILVRLAAAVRRGDRAPLDAAKASGAGDPALLQTQVAWLLEQSGEAELAASLRAAPEAEERSPDAPPDP